MNDEEKSKFSRRKFLKTFSAGVGGLCIVAQAPSFFLPDDETLAIAASQGYLLVDTKKCSGCISCMLACSLVHEGKENLCLSRIQIVQDCFGKFPDDITIGHCRQCEEPRCVRVCETGALGADGTNGNVRTVDSGKCIGCMRCVQVCPFMPARVQWNFETNHAQKCDLCTHTPFWDEQGGAAGKQACVETCPVKAIRFTDRMPVQQGDSGYDVNLRNENWKKLGFPIV